MNQLKKVDVVVAGAGFAGLACAEVLARAGAKVVVLERKRAPATGLHTTGIVVKEAAARLALPDAMVRPVSHVRLYSPSRNALAFASPDYFFLATDTPAVLQWLTARAETAGAEIRFAEPFREQSLRCAGPIALPAHGLACDWLVGADGARSAVARAAGLARNRRFLIGTEAEFVGLDLGDPPAFHCYLHRRLAPGYLAWAVPGVGVTQIGLACRGPVRPDIAAFIDHLRPQFDFSTARIVARRGGLVPVGGVISPVARGNVVLLGDAAGVVSPLTAGGIHTAVHFGTLLGELIAAHRVDGSAPHPARVLAARYPRYRLKLLLRWALENLAHDRLVDALIASAPFRWLAEKVFFRENRLSR